MTDRIIKDGHEEDDDLCLRGRIEQPSV